MADEPITRRDSGNLATFKSAVTEALAKLDAYGRRDERDHSLFAEGQRLLGILRGWEGESAILIPPSDRAKTISEVLDFHRNVGEYTSR